MTELQVSRLNHTWLIDVDGTMVRHNGHLSAGDELLPGVVEFWAQIPAGDTIVLLSARAHYHQAATLHFFDQKGLRYDHAVFGLPTGERILINDRKPNGLPTALALNLPRNQGLGELHLQIDPLL